VDGSGGRHARAPRRSGLVALGMVAAAALVGCDPVVEGSLTRQPGAGLCGTARLETRNETGPIP